MATDEEYDDIGITGYLGILKKRAPVILLTIAGALVIGLVYILLATPVYEARSQLLVERSGPKVLSIEEVYSIDSAQQDHYRTQCEIILSRNVLNQVISRLKLTALPPFSKSKDPAAVLEKMLRAQPVRNSRLITVSTFGSDPAEITRINHAVIDVFMQQQLENKLGVSETASDWLSGQIAPLRTSLKSAEAKVQSFLEKAGISSIREADILINQKISSVNKSLIEARKDRMEIESRYRRFQEAIKSGTDIYTLPIVAHDGLIKELTREKISLEREFTRISEIYRPGHPEMRRLREQIGFIDEEMSKQARNIAEITRRDYMAEKYKEDSLQDLIQKLNRGATQLNKMKVTYNILERDVESSRRLCEAVVDRLKETDVIDDLTSSGVRVVDRAEVPRVPIKPRKNIILLLSAVLGFFAGLGLAVYIDNSDTSFRSSEEVEKYLHLPVLGRIPYLPEKHRDVIALDLMSYSNPRSSLAEAFRYLRTYLETIARETGSSSFLITSSSPREGKTDVAINLAISLAEAGRSVIILDADMRRPRLHKTFGLVPAPGLNKLLQGKSTLNEVIRATEIPQLSVIPCGEIPPRPAELIQAGTFPGVIAELKKRFDYLILDSPPLHPVTDAIILADMADAVIQVVQGEKTPRELAREARNRLSQCRARLVGVVLAQIKRFPRHYYNNYYR